jgi:hypothetical protein
MALLVKTWLAFWTNSSVPALGLAATIKIRRVDTGAVVQATVAMTEIGDGWYKFVQAAFDDSLQYAAVMDGSAAVTPQERYQAAAAPADGEDRITIAKSVDAELTAEHGAGGWTSASAVDWSTAEREQIRAALGIVGAKSGPSGGGQLQAILAESSLARKVLTNRLELKDGDSGNWILYDDDDSPLLEFDVTDVNDGPIVNDVGVPAKRTKGV